MRLLHYLIHPVQSRSVANAALWQSTRSFDGITRVDLYADYPRHNINADTEQKQLLDHDIIAFQFPMFWYAAPSLLKEWTNLVLEQGFAFGPKGDKLRGKKDVVGNHNRRIGPCLYRELRCPKFVRHLLCLVCAV